MEPRYNEPLYNEVLGIIKKKFFAPVIVEFMKKNLDITEPHYNEHIVPVPWPFVTLRFHCSMADVELLCRYTVNKSLLILLLKTTLLRLIHCKVFCQIVHSSRLILNQT